MTTILLTLLLCIWIAGWLLVFGVIVKGIWTNEKAARRERELSGRYGRSRVGL